MSDGLSDVARDQERYKNFGVYTLNLLRFFNEPSACNYLSLRVSAREVDSVKRGYWTGNTKLEEGLNDFLITLGNNDIKAWDFILLEHASNPPVEVISEAGKQLKLLKDKYPGFNYPKWIDQK